MISLQPMTDPDFQEYLKTSIQKYADEKIQAGNWAPAEAMERSRKEFEGYLPRGVHTPFQYLFNLVNEDGEKVGLLWYAELTDRPGNAFIYDFEIYDAFRRRGYASQALLAVEKDARQRGLKQIGLHVFGHNTAARELYKKAGYLETNVNMSKKIPESDPDAAHE
jgi:ribosomal protein S18 acetylase RimI-like enzyme